LVTPVIKRNRRSDQGSYGGFFWNEAHFYK
jgi:hypothetical protein